MSQTASIRQKVRGKAPLIHCITNPISINQCANAILAVGARPIMAEHPEEVAEITATADALMLNLGNITDARMESMAIAAEAANRKGIPIVLDLVGIACSTLRRKYVEEFLTEHTVTLLKGNYSELLALAEPSYRSSGVDADTNVTSERVRGALRKIWETYGAMVLASGVKDLVWDGSDLSVLSVGTPRLAQVTGTGCMLGALCACFLAADPGRLAPETACLILGIAGERAETEEGTGTFMVRLMDEIGTLPEDILEDRYYDI